jgi:hypothetical protein
MFDTIVKRCSCSFRWVSRGVSVWGGGCGSYSSLPSVGKTDLVVVAVQTFPTLVCLSTPEFDLEDVAAGKPAPPYTPSPLPHRLVT